MSSQTVLPRRSRRLATFIPASHWISIGYSQDDAQLMEKLQSDMKKYCDDGSEDEILIKGRRSGAIPHHDMLIPHWKKLFKALCGRASINSLRMMGISLPVSVLDIMFPTLQNINISEVALDVQFGNEGLLRLTSFIKNSTSIKTIVLGRERIRDLSIANSLSDVVKDHPTLEMIALVGCGLSDDANILRKVLEGFTKIRSFTIAHEKLGLESVGILADCIRSNHHTNKKLRLDSNNISDGGTLLLASALNSNTNLNWLNLKNNDITEEGDKHLLKALYDPTSMDSIVESNHTCVAYTYDVKNARVVAQRPPIETEVLSINNADPDISTKQKIRWKVVLALCGLEG